MESKESPKVKWVSAHLHKYWNPIGDVPADEYDSYAEYLLPILDNATVDNLASVVGIVAAYLATMRHRNILPGLTSDNALNRAVSDDAHVAYSLVRAWSESDH